ncbi:MAG TPA: CoA transferase [Blastocatellia bacterium]|nr:CoA transferase [Blastocatellia bacterium]
MTGPLTGIRVIDFGRFIAAPYCAMLFADMGADVIRVERRGGGEDRYLGPVTGSGEGALFLNLNRNKRGVTLDPAHPMAEEIVRRLVRNADIIIANLPVDALKKLRLDYESLRAMKEDIIMVMASAFGPDGPYANRVGFDSVAQAMSGAMSLTGFPGVPVRSAVSFVDYGTALHAAFGAMVALYERQRSGRGQVIDVSLLTTGLTFMQPLLIERAVADIRRRQQGNASFHAAPADVYRTRDGWIIAQAIGNPMFARWARLVGREDLIGDPRFADDISRADHYEVINQAMQEWCSGRARQEVITELQRARIPCGPVYNLDEALADPQVNARELFREVEYPGCLRPIPLSATPVRLSATPGGISRRAPAVGEHTEEVLAEVGFTAEEIAAFRKAGAI